MPKRAQPQFHFYYSEDGNKVVKDTEQTKAQIGRMLQYLFDTDYGMKDCSYTFRGKLEGGILGDVVVKNKYGAVLRVIELTYDEPGKTQQRKNKALRSSYGTRTTFLYKPMTERGLRDKVVGDITRALGRY
jgi:hypothetical protein